jgi:FAD:protein FMN transferase
MNWLAPHESPNQCGALGNGATSDQTTYGAIVSTARRREGNPQQLSERYGIIRILCRPAAAQSSRVNRRAFLKFPTLLPFISYNPDLGGEQHHFKYEGIIGTSMDLVVWTTDYRVAAWTCRTVLGEIRRLASILNARDPTSEISLLESNRGRSPSHELSEVLDAYDYWERRTNGVFSIRPAGADTPRNVDALGKAYILDRAANAAKKTWPSIQGLMLNIGGDIVTSGKSCEIAIADPAAWYDNARPVATILLQNAAVATSGTYARGGADLINARSRQSAGTATAATVVASDAVTANALATTLCLTDTDDGLRLVESTPSAEAIRIVSGVLHRTSGFSFLERPSLAVGPAMTNWPPGYHLTLTLPLKTGRSTKRPYVVVWVEDSSGRPVRTLALWGNKSKYYPDLSTAWSFLWRNQNQLRSVTRATRPAGKYELEWDGLDNEHNACSYRKTTPASLSADASRCFLIARPPLHSENESPPVFRRGFVLKNILKCVHRFSS